MKDTEFHPQHLIREMSNFLKNEGCIHLIIFVFKNSRFTKEDSEAFGFIARLFKPVIKDISLLVITCCEVLSKTARKDLVANFRTEQSTKDIAAVMERGIEPVGFPNLETVREPLIPIFEENVKEDSDTLRNKVKSCIKSLSRDDFEKHYSDLQKNQVEPSRFPCQLPWSLISKLNPVSYFLSK